MIGTLSDIALLVLRCWLGVVMIAHGGNHLRDVSGTASWFESIGFKQARLVALGSGLGEAATGIALVLGLLTSVASAGLVSVMVIAYVVVHRTAGFFVFNRPDEGWEYVATLAVAATVVALAGPGSFSLDEAWGLAITGGWGLASVAAGVVVSGLILGVLWRPESGEDG